MSLQLPGRITTRSASRAAQEMTSLAVALKKKLDYFTRKLQELIEKVNDDETLSSWSRGNLSERQKNLETWQASLTQVHMDAICDLDIASQADFADDKKLTEDITTAKARLSDRLHAMSQAAPSQAGIVLGREQIKFEVSQVDVTGNIPNIWGKFDGDYSKWRSFRDRWIAAIHNNEKVTTIVKFQNLMSACTDAAKGALGEWDLTNENYLKAWERLQAIYEDDYMQVQSFMQKLAELPRISGTSSKTIRDTIDIVQKHVHGVKQYIKVGDENPYVVFAVINKMDSSVFRAWEKYRPSFTKADATPTDGEASSSRALRTGKHIPTWPELEKFLEGEVTIRVHEERRNAADNAQPSTSQTSGNQNGKPPNRARKHAENETRNVAHVCPICNGEHLIYRCDTFIDMNIVSRMNQVTEYDLCVRCLQKSHEGRCRNKLCNKPCKKCQGSKFHNSMLCPNRDSDSNVNEQQKRSHSGDRHRDSKRSRRDSGEAHSSGMQSSVHKVGDWSIMNKNSNALSSVKRTEREQ